MTHAVRASKEMQQNGFLIFPFPSSLSQAMKGHICNYIGLTNDALYSKTLPDDLTKKVLAYSGEEFLRKFAKPFRMFPDSVAAIVLDWLNGLTERFQASRLGINYVCPEEQEKNPTLRQDSYDLFWRCVRPGQPDVGAPHCDYQFWELAKGTNAEVRSPFTYDQRWKVWVPLLGCDVTNSLQVVPGSHVQEVPTDRVMTKNGYRPVIQPHWLEKHEEAFTCPLTTFGDFCVLFHDRLVHRGPPNNTSKLRLSGELTILLKQ